MKKYYVVGTDEEVILNDSVEVTFEKELGNGIKLKRDEEFKITEDSIPYLLELGVLEESDEKEDEDLVDFEDEDEEGWICEAIEELNQEIEKLKERLNTQNGTLKSMMESLKKCIENVDGFIKGSGETAKKAGKKK